MKADYKIQTMLIRAIHSFFPKLKIVGEETTEYLGLIELDLKTITIDNSPEGFGLEEPVPISELCLWIDPIDNTKGFINGALDCVTILIGLSRNHRAYLGVLGLPYRKTNEGVSFEP
jgi:3'(2'), 5'-bisphosphate nucleotidase